MKIKNSDTQYAGLVITMHWLMLVVLALVYACMELRGLATKGTELYDNVKALHFSLGLCVIGLVVLRVVIRVASGAAPGVRPPMPRWQDVLSRLMHYALYAFMIVTPILGWLTLSAGGRRFRCLGWRFRRWWGRTRPWRIRSRNCMRPWLRWGISWWGCMLLRRCCITMCFGITRWCGCCRGGVSVSSGVGARKVSANPWCRRSGGVRDGGW
ncbi:hypothetical protein BN2877_45720 [Achromobacter xylosoxidans]|nr:hypothetical protein BN2877_45720 [Achromobacter xylosoxidans]